MPPADDIHLTPWDLIAISFKYMQTGILVPKPPAGGERSLVDSLVSSLARALGRHYHLAGRLAVVDHGDGTVSIPLRCTGEGAELVHAVAPGVSVAEVVGTLQYTPSSVVRAFFPLKGVYGADIVVDPSLPVVGAQVTELADGVFIAMSMNHAVGDGSCLWELFSTWSAINRGEELTVAPAPANRRWFIETSPVPIYLPFSSLQDLVVGRLETPLVGYGFFTFSASSVRKLKAQARDEMPEGNISSLQALVAHLWRAVARARSLVRGQETSCDVIVGCRGRMRGIPAGYGGNAVVPRRTPRCTVGEILDKGLGWTAWQLKRAVESFEEEEVRGWLDRWAREPVFMSPSAYQGDGALVIAGSPLFDFFLNDFGWGKPVGLRGCPGEKADGIVSVRKGPGQQGSISLEVTLVPETMERLVADHEFMEAVAVPPA
ncbi:hypothetical protein QYE76_071820 [Lolium multiflorum]|uniref:HXXXD-type acyl-transferase family protein n=1 Tax=Lolium multiflorum TaxID=4521 RepID=A0AAD8SMX8_LOLMU|nr:hypothetical protein QYE76_071820 [Lolium multiflorum]